MAQENSYQEIHLIDSNGFEVNIDGVIADSGMTSIVYLGRVGEKKAAIKILRPGASKIIREYFRSERMNMVALKTGWEKLYPGEKCVVPEVYAFNDTGEYPFIAMELINGTPIDDYVSKFSSLSEKQSLEIALQFGKLLHVLHREANQTYADIKIDNLWILNERDDNDKLHLKVLDWNILANHSKEGVVRDLFYASLYLIRLVLNDTPATNGVFIQGPIDQLSKFNKLTRSMQYLLRQLLNNNTSIRPGSAVEWVEFLQNNYDLWVEPLDTLRNRVDEISLMIEGGPEENKLSQIEISNLLNSQIIDLEILKERVRSDEEHEMLRIKIDQVRNFAKNYSNLDIGKTFLKGGNFDQALNQFEKGAELIPIERENFLRWFWYTLGASQIGRETFQNIRDEIISIAEYHVNGDYRRVMSGFKTLDIEKLPNAWQSLYNEAEIYVLDEKARGAKTDHKYDEAVEIYESCIALKDSLPTDPPTRWLEYMPDLHDLYNDSSHLAQTIGLFYKLLEEADQKHLEGDYCAAVNAMRHALSAMPDEKNQVIVKWINKIKECLHKDEDGAYMYIDHGMATAFVQDAIRSFYLYSVALRNAEAALSIDKPLEAFEIIKTFWGKQIDNPDNLISINTDKFIQRLFNQALITDNFELINAILSFADVNQLDWAQDTLRKSFEEAKNTKLELIFNLTQQETLNSYREAEKLIDQLMSYFQDDDPEIKEKQEIFKQIKIKRENLETTYKIDENRIGELRAEIDSIVDQLESINQLKVDVKRKLNKISIDDEVLSDEVIPGLDQKYATLIGYGFNLVDQYSKLIKNVGVDDSSKYRDTLFNYIDPSTNVLPALFNVFSTREESSKYRSLEALFLTKAKENFEAGSPEKAIEWLNLKSHGGPLSEEEQKILSASEKAISLQTLNTVEAFESIDLGYYRNLPAIYWKNLPYIAEHYTKNIEKDLLLLRQLPIESKEFPSVLSAIVNYQNKIGQIKVLSGHKNDTTTRMDLTDIVESAIVYKKNPTQQNETLLLNKIEQLPNSHYIPENFHSILPKKLSRSEKKERRSIYKVTTFVFIPLLMICLIASVFFFLYPDESQGFFRNYLRVHHPNEEKIHMTQTQVSILEGVATQAAIPTTTPVPTISIDEVPISIEPTPIPVSVFNVVDHFLPDQPWVFPNYGEIRYIIDLPEINYHDTNQIQPISGFGYSENFSILHGTGNPLGPINIRWALDTEIIETGFYEIFVSDPSDYGGFKTSRLKYFVYQNEQAILPQNGDGLVAFQTPDEQEYNQWISLGVYKLNADLPVSVEVNEGDLFLADGEILPIDAVLILKIDAPDLEIPLVKDLVEVKQANLLYWIDDSQAKIAPPVEGSFGPTDESQRHTATWNGETQIILDKNPKNISMTWELKHQLWGKGNKFRIGFWVSPSIQKPVEYELFINNQKSGDVFIIDPENDTGQFKYFNVFEIPDDSKYSIKVEMRTNWIGLLPGDDSQFIIAGDVVTIEAIKNNTD